MHARAVSGQMAGNTASALRVGLLLSLAGKVWQCRRRVLLGSVAGLNLAEQHWQQEQAEDACPRYRNPGARIGAGAFHHVNDFRLSRMTSTLNRVPMARHYKTAGSVNTANNPGHSLELESNRHETRKQRLAGVDLSQCCAGCKRSHAPGDDHVFREWRAIDQTRAVIEPDARIDPGLEEKEL